MNFATTQVSRADMLGNIDWIAFADALEAGHRLPEAEVEDVFLGPPGRTLLSRAAWIKGLGYGVKSVTVMGENAALNLPTVQGAMLVFDDNGGRLRATLDSALVTDIKTAADSVLGARLLARKDSKTHLMVGAGAVAKQLIRAYRQVFPGLEKTLIWNRTIAKAQNLVAEIQADGLDAAVVSNLKEAVTQADLISTATMSFSPILLGQWVQPGTHVDLIGAFRAEMREADDTLLQRARIFVDSRRTTVQHIGELKIPMESGAIAETDILADLYQLAAGMQGRTSSTDITVFKNGGGAHLDLMTADAILKSVSQHNDK